MFLGCSQAERHPDFIGTFGGSNPLLIDILERNFVIVENIFGV